MMIGSVENHEEAHHVDEMMVDEDEMGRHIHIMLYWNLSSDDRFRVNKQHLVAFLDCTEELFGMNPETGMPFRGKL